jgi:hypothetical protein
MTVVVRTSTEMATKSTISPKIAWPALALAALAVVLIILGAVNSIVQDASTRDTLLTIGLALLGASGVTGTIGYTAPPGQVKVPQ